MSWQCARLLYTCCTQTINENKKLATIFMDHQRSTASRYRHNHYHSLLSLTFAGFRWHSWIISSDLSKMWTHNSWSSIKYTCKDIIRTLYVAYDKPFMICTTEILTTILVDLLKQSNMSSPCSRPSDLWPFELKIRMPITPARRLLLPWARFTPILIFLSLFE